MDAVATIPPFETFYTEHAGEVLALLRRRLGCDRADDAFQETFLRALRAYERLKHGEHLRAWVLTIAARVAIDTHRRAGEPTDELPELAHLDGRPAHEELAFLTDALPPKEQAAVVLRYGYDLDYTQIAASPRFERGRRATGDVFRRATAAKEADMTVPTDLDHRFRDAAARSGLLDAAYDVFESPLGELLVATTDRGLLRVSYVQGFDPIATIEEIARLAGRRVMRSGSAVDGARRELDEYFDGSRRSFDLQVDLRGQAPFSVAVLGELAQVPYGRTATYGELASRAGSPKGARAVGMVMNRNPIPIVLPCHRIVGASGSLVGYAGGLERKEQLLRLEGAML